MNRIKVSLGFSLLAMVLAGAVAFAAPAATPKPGTGNFVQKLVSELRSSGLEVSVGYPRRQDASAGSVHGAADLGVDRRMADR